MERQILIIVLVISIFPFAWFTIKFSRQEVKKMFYKGYYKGFTRFNTYYFPNLNKPEPKRIKN